MPKPIPDSLKENIVATLATSASHGAMVAGLIDPTLMQGVFRIVAERCKAYWEEHGRPPGVHTIDLFGDILSRRDDPNAAQLKEVLAGIHGIKDGLDGAFVVSQIAAYHHYEKLQTALYGAADMLGARGVGGTKEAEDLLLAVLNERLAKGFTRGVTLDNVDTYLDYMAGAGQGITVGIEALDKRHILPRRKELFLLIASAKVGKSWWMVHVGKKALRQRLKVFHCSLEMIEEQVLGRYYQSLFYASRRQTSAEIIHLELDAKRQFTGASRESVQPDFILEDRELTREEMKAGVAVPIGNAADELRNRLRQMGRLTNNLRIKSWSPGSLDIMELRGYLRSLEVLEGWRPDVVLVDYPKLMKLDKDPKNLRASLGKTFESLRALAVDEDMAVVAVHQSSREGSEARMVKATHASEDWSIVQTADTVCTLSATDHEHRLGLARMYVDRCRSEADKITMVITQNYAFGQFVIDSVLLPPNYYDFLESGLGGMAHAEEPVVVDEVPETDPYAFG